MSGTKRSKLSVSGNEGIVIMHPDAIITRSNITRYWIQYNNAVINVHHTSAPKPTIDTPHLSFLDELRGVYCGYFEKIDRALTTPYLILVSLAGNEHDLLWIPRELPEGAHMLLSTLPGRVSWYAEFHTKSTSVWFVEQTSGIVYKTAS